MTNSPPTDVTKSSPTAKNNQNIVAAAKGGGIVFSGKIFSAALRFITGMVLARFLGAEQYGLYTLALTAVSLGSGLAVMGLKDTTVRYVSLFNNRNDEKRLWGVLQIVTAISSVLSLVLAIGLYILADTIAQQIFQEPRLVPLLRLISISFPFLALGLIFAAATRGFKDMIPTVLSQDFVQLPRFVLILLLILIGLSVLGVVGVFVVISILSFILSLYYLNKKFTLRRPLRDAQYEFKEILNFSYPIYFSDLIKTFGRNIQTILLGVLNTVANVGIFSIAAQINTIGQTFHLAIVTTSMPIVSALYDQDNKEELNRFYKTMTKWTFTLNLPFFLIVVIFPEEILSIFGDSFINGGAALSVLAWANLINAGTGICGVLLDMSGNTILKLVNSIVAVILSISLNILLIPIWGLMGAAIAALIAASITNLLRLLEVFFLFRILPYDISFLKPIIAGIIASIVLFLINQIYTIDVHSLFLVGISILVILGTYAGSILLLGLSTEDQEVLNRLRQRIPILSRKKN